MANLPGHALAQANTFVLVITKLQKAKTMSKEKSEVYKRQEQLSAVYQKAPGKAWITDVAEVTGVNLADPFRSHVTINDELSVHFPVGVHRAIGGDHDSPNSGDILCAALACCFETTLRMIANRLQIQLLHTHVKALADVDVRGTLMISSTVPVGFQSMRLEVEIMALPDNAKLIQALLATAKHSCIVYQIISKGTPIKVEMKVLDPIVEQASAAS